MDVCELMPTDHALQLAIKYASRLRQLTLAEKVSELMRKRAAEAQEPEGEEEEEEEIRWVSWWMLSIWVVYMYLASLLNLWSLYCYEL